MGDTGREQSYRGKLVRLRELRFQFHTFRDVIHNNQSPDHIELPGDQGGDRHIHNAILTGRRAQSEFV